MLPRGCYPFGHQQRQPFDHFVAKQGLINVAHVCKIDATKRSGDTICDIPLPDGLFEREVFVNCGPSMLKRFQMNGQTLEGQLVADRLLLTY